MHVADLSRSLSLLLLLSLSLSGYDVWLHAYVCAATNSILEILIR